MTKPGIKSNQQYTSFRHIIVIVLKFQETISAQLQQAGKNTTS